MQAASTQLIDRKGLHSRIYERTGPDGTGRQVVKESVAELKRPQVFADQSRISIRNEYRAIQYVKEHTTIPVPMVVEFHDEPGSPVQIIMEFAEGLPPRQMGSIPETAERLIVKQLEGFISQMQALTDPDCRSFAGRPVFGLRLEQTFIPIQDFAYRTYNSGSPYVLTHGDLAWHNLLIDPHTWEIKCVLDWEYAGFYPKEVESEYWRRKGPIWGEAGVGREGCDVDDVLRVLWCHKLEVAGPQPDKDTSGSVSDDMRQHLLDVPLPSGTTPSVAAVYSHSIEVGRRRIASDLEELSLALTADNRAVDHLINVIDTDDTPFPETKLHHMHFAPFTTLANQLELSQSAFNPLRDHISVELDLVLQLKRNGPKKPLQHVDDDMEDTELRQRLREMRTERRNLADEAYRQSAKATWPAIKEFATSLLHLATAAEALTPYLADYDQERPTARLDVERAWAQHRAADLAAGGTGGYVVRVADDVEVAGRLKEEFMAKWDATKDEREKTARLIVERAPGKLEAIVRAEERVRERSLLQKREARRMLEAEKLRAQETQEPDTGGSEQQQ